jgi:hypothetical protein
MTSPPSTERNCRQALSYTTSKDVIFTVYSATSGEPSALALRRLARMNWP